MVRSENYMKFSAAGAKSKRAGRVSGNNTGESDDLVSPSR